MNTTPQRSELLMPAGSLLKLKTAILYGADAVYAGTPDLCMRTKSSFSLEELCEGVEYVHSMGKRIYLTLNLFSHNKDIEKLPTFVETIRKVKPDGVIIADPGVFQYVKEHAPELELHVSTQANICSWLTVDFWVKQGAKLVVLGREVSYEELKEIREKCPDVKIEIFIHGSMCMTYSGRCLLSNFLAERGANQGNCAHSCRWNYKLHVQLKDGSTQEITINENNKDLFEFLIEEEYRPGEFIPLEEDMRGAYILNSKDLCLMPKLPEYLELGIESLKVEGRNKTNYYAALVARTYRKAIDDWYTDPENWNFETYMAELDTIQNRGYTLAFHEGRLTHHSHNYESGKSIATHEFAGFIREWDGDDMILELKNFILPGELIQFLSPVQWEPIRMRLQEFVDAQDGKVYEKVSAGQERAIRIPASIFEGIPKEHLKEILPANTVARKRKILRESEKKRLLAELEVRKAEINNLPVNEERKAELLMEARKEAEKIERIKVRGKGPKMGSEGCCGKGCNGCMIFWKDPKFEKARELLAQKKPGELLSKKVH